MHFSLLRQSKIHFDLLSEDIKDGPFWVQSNRDWLSFVKKRLRDNLDTNKVYEDRFRIAM